MRIVVLNNRYHVTGGPERYLFSVKEMLEAAGHEVIPFSVRYDRNEPSEWSSYFAPPPGGSDAVYFRDVRGPIARARLFARTVYSPESRDRLTRLLDAVRPDVVYVIIVANYLSPSVLHACRDARVPVVMRLSDFHLLAPCYTCFDGKSACDLCLHGTRLHAVRKRCVQGSAAVSLARVAGMAIHDRLGLYDIVQRFVAPSKFLREKLITAGLEPERIVHVPTFIDASPTPPAPPGDGLLYVGRLEPEKGVSHLLDAWRLAGEPGELRIVGPRTTPEARRLLKRAHDERFERVRFLGEKTREDVSVLMREARAVAVPSICYENLPIAALEAMAQGRAIVANAIGSLPEVVEDGVTGFLADPDNPAAMAGRIRLLQENEKRADELGREGWRRARERFAPAAHLERLTEILESVTANERDDTIRRRAAMGG